MNSISSASELTGYRKRVILRQSISSATIEIADIEFDGSEFEGIEERSLLRWRTRPHGADMAWSFDRERGYTSIGNLMFLPANMPFKAKPGIVTKSHRNLLCQFGSELDQRISEQAGAWTQGQLAVVSDIRCHQIEFTLQRLSHELMHPGPASVLLLEGLLATLAVDIGRYFYRSEHSDLAALSGNRRVTFSESELQRIKDFIHGARGGCPTSAQLADLCGMTISSFRFRFKQATGTSVHSFVEQLQLQRAKNMLINTNMLMKEIAYELGFTHQATFTSSFRRMTGLSPSEYRTAQMH